MKFGKRRDKQAPEGDGVVEAPPAPDSVTQDWTALGHDPGQPAEPSMPPPEQDAAPQPEPVAEPEPVAAEAEAVVEGEAVELPYEAPAVAQAPEPEPDPEPAPEPAAPVYEAPIYPHPIDPDPVASVAASTPHHEPGLIPGETDLRPASGGAWPEPAFDLAERPEILVGAAFGGGILFALILRRLGH